MTNVEQPTRHLVTVPSGEAALAELLHRDFAVVLMDVRMPTMDGFETVARIKAREQKPKGGKETHTDEPF